MLSSSSRARVCVDEGLPATIAMQNMPPTMACELLIQWLRVLRKEAFDCYSGFRQVARPTSAAADNLRVDLLTHRLCAFGEGLRKTGLVALFHERHAVLHRDEDGGDWYLVPSLSELRRIMFEDVESHYDVQMDAAIAETAIAEARRHNSGYRRLYELRVRKDTVAFKYAGMVPPARDAEILDADVSIDINAITHPSYVPKEKEPWWVRLGPWGWTCWTDEFSIPVDADWRSRVEQQVNDKGVGAMFLELHFWVFGVSKYYDLICVHLEDGFCLCDVLDRGRVIGDQSMPSYREQGFVEKVRTRKRVHAYWGVEAKVNGNRQLFNILSLTPLL